MPHNWKYDIKTLRELVATTIKTSKLEKERLHKLQLKQADELQFSDRKIIINWSRASIADFNEKLDVMEEITEPSAEERQVMQQLTELIFLGDQIGDIQGEVEKRLDAKFGKVDWMYAADIPEGSYMRKDGTIVIPGKRPQPVETIAPAFGKTVLPKHELPAARPPHSTVPSMVEPQPKPTAKDSFATTHPARATVRGASKDQFGGHAIPGQANTNLLVTGGTSKSIGGPDTEEMYGLLGLTPEASMEQIRKAARRIQIILHPDKNKDDPDANIKFTEFTTLYQETLGDEGKRRAYDNITAADMVDLTQRVKKLTVRHAPPK